MPKNVTETEATIQQIEANRQKYEETGDPRYQRVANTLEMNMAFGGKPPAGYVKARTSINQAREGLAETYNLIAKGRANPLSPKDRAAVKQSLDQTRLAYAEMLNRGANFTESEQRMINNMLGGDPNDIAMRVLRGDESYLELLQKAGETLERRGQDLMDAFTTPGAGQFQYPWQRGGGAAQQPQTREAGTIPSAQPQRMRFDAQGNLVE